MTDYTELCQRLRNRHLLGDCVEASAAIEALVAERDALRLDRDRAQAESFKYRRELHTHALESNVAKLTEIDWQEVCKERDALRDELYDKCACSMDVDNKDGFAPPKAECGYHARLRAELREAVAILRMIQPCSDLMVCYASTISKHPMNAIPGRVDAFLVKHTAAGTTPKESKT